MKIKILCLSTPADKTLPAIIARSTLQVQHNSDPMKDTKLLKILDPAAKKGPNSQTDTQPWCQLGPGVLHKYL